MGKKEKIKHNESHENSNGKKEKIKHNQQWELGKVWWGKCNGKKQSMKHNESQEKSYWRG